MRKVRLRDKEFFVHVQGERRLSGCKKIGGLVGDHLRIGANAVLVPGTLLQKKSIVGRGALCDGVMPTAWAQRPTLPAHGFNLWASYR